jgi:hypothetical protein
MYDIKWPIMKIFFKNSYLIMEFIYFYEQIIVKEFVQ